jgi:hypothetical protein
MGMLRDALLGRAESEAVLGRIGEYESELTPVESGGGPAQIQAPRHVKGLLEPPV